MWRTAISGDELAKKSLARYFATVQNKKMAKFIIAKKSRLNLRTMILWKRFGNSTRNAQKSSSK
jgi:hypothetical protein